MYLVLLIEILPIVIFIQLQGRYGQLQMCARKNKLRIALARLDQLTGSEQGFR